MSGSVKAADAYVELGVRDRITKSLGGIRGKLKKFASKVNAIANTTARAAAAVLAPLTLAVRTFVKVGDEIGKTAKRTFMGVKAVQSLGYAAEQSGASLQSVEKGMKGMQRNILDANRNLKTAIDNFDDLGISIDDLNGKRPEDQFRVAMKALAGVSDETKRAALANKLFGRAGQELLPMLGNIDELEKKFNALGTAMSEKEVAAAEDLADAFNELRKGAIKIAAAIGEALSGSIKQFIEDAKRVVGSVVGWIKSNKEIVISVAKAAAGALALAGALKVVAAAAGIIASMANPFGAVVAGAAAALVVVNKLNKAMGNTYKDLTAIGGKYGPSKKSVLGNHNLQGGDGTKKTNQGIIDEANRRFEAGNLSGAKRDSIVKNAQMGLDGVSNADRKKMAADETAKRGAAFDNAYGSLKKTVVKGFFDNLVTPAKEFKNTVMIDLAEARLAFQQKGKANRKAREQAKADQEIQDRAAEVVQRINNAQATTETAFGMDALGFKGSLEGTAIVDEKEFDEAKKQTAYLEAIARGVQNGGVL